MFLINVRQRKCNKAVDRCFIVFDFIPNRYKTNEMCDRVVSKNSFKLMYCVNRFCNEAVSLPALNFILDWVFTSKYIKKLPSALYVDDEILYFKETSGDAIFTCIEMGIPSVDLNNIALNNTNYDEDGASQIIFHVRRLA